MTTTDTTTPAATPRIGDWILTRTGKRFYPLDPRAEDVAFGDISHALAMLCRWTGHCAYHYSVAQHAVNVACMVEAFAPDLALAALHHDSAEAYIGDWSRPLKRSVKIQRAEPNPNPTDLGAMIAALPESIERTEHRVRCVIFDALGIREPIAEGWAVIRTADNLVLHAEKKALLPDDDAIGWGHLGTPPISMNIIQRHPTDANMDFMMMHQRLAAAH
jgi:uncharacterized protein